MRPEKSFNQEDFNREDFDRKDLGRKDLDRKDVSPERRVPGLVCLGIDPGLARMGYGVVRQSGSTVSAVSFGCVETPSGMAFERRLLCLYEALGEQMDACPPDFVCVESLFFGNNRTTAGYVWQARGVVMLLAAQRGLSVLEPKPAQVKMAVCGTGTADKTQVQKMVQRLLALDALPKPDDAADALAAALAGLAYYEYERKTGGRLS